jgi:hypothetical protein
VAELRARGLTLPEIGRRLGLSKQLVHYYVRLAGGPPGRVAAGRMHQPRSSRFTTPTSTTRAASAPARASWMDADTMAANLPPNRTFLRFFV